MKYLFYLLLWCAVDGNDIINCSETMGVCDLYDTLDCQQCYEYEFTTECLDVGATTYD